MALRVIVVEDEPLTRRAFALALREAGFQVVEASDVYACRAALRAEEADVIVLDIGLPGPDGLSLAQELRESGSTGLVMVSRRDDPDLRVRALDLGADDFLVKPVHFGELVARVRSVHRRRRNLEGLRLQFGGWRVDLEARSLTREGSEAGLTRGEFDLLRRLLEAEGKIVAREVLLRAISPRAEESDPRSVDALVSRIRRRLGPGADGSACVLTAPGFGYRINPTWLEPANRSHQSVEG